jgi:hypothetical protein
MCSTISLSHTHMLATHPGKYVDRKNRGKCKLELNTSKIICLALPSTNDLDFDRVQYHFVKFMRRNDMATKYRYSVIVLRISICS